MTMSEEVDFWDNCDITDYVDLSMIRRLKIELTPNPHTVTPKQNSSP